MNRTIHRRHLLRGAGVSLALPLLEAMTRVPRAEPPRRSAFLYLPNGVNMLAWQILEAGEHYTLTEPLQPLAPHRTRLTPISGLHHPSALGKNHACDRTWLTAAHEKEGDRAAPNTVSADQLMAEVAGVHTRFPSLELTVTKGTLAWSREGVPLPAERKPAAVFERLFGRSRGGVQERRERLRRKRSVLDLVLEDAHQFRRRVGQEDGQRLDEYLAAVRQVEQRAVRAEAWLDVPRPEIGPGDTERLTRDLPDENAGEYYRTLIDLMVLALRTDSTRVLTCMLGSESHALALPEIGIRQTRHELSHHRGDPNLMEQLTRTDRFHVEHLAYFLDQLQGIEEEGETLLDRTAVLFGSGMAYGHGHGNANLPLLLAGGEALGFRHGRHVDFNLPEIGAYDLENAGEYHRLCLRPVNERARMSDLLLTMVQRMGVETPSFGDSTGGLSEV